MEQRAKFFSIGQLVVPSDNVSQLGSCSVLQAVESNSLRQGNQDLQETNAVFLSQTSIALGLHTKSTVQS